ncbi:ChaN family lipoprotein [Geomonas sp.]|uniref:ChaN family lipoprotein n=1 Tax=Geomonas sp. TaxID=2651584 RepID=UPI002B4A7A60|nr:ChaN family lipoprotein [Geomonas sp.]HJV35765.1 ChaN family lipoprotein [Geomonas sp.]
MSMIPQLMLPLLLAATAALADAHQVITRTSDGRTIDLPELTAQATGSDLVLIGESHDIKSHHEMELAVIRALWDRKLPLAIGLEMMQTDTQQQLDDWTEGRIEESQLRQVFTANWSDYEMYRDIFLFAREHRIPMIAMNVPREIVSKVAHHGFASLTTEEKQGLPKGTSCDINNPNTRVLLKTFRRIASHRAAGQMFTNFCEAQTLRNSGMALNIARYHGKHPDRKIVGLTGIWHAVRNAIPEQLSRNGSKLDCLVILLETPEAPAGTFEADSADYLIDM